MPMRLDRKRKRRGPLMYVWTCTTPYGYKYNRFTDSPDEPPYNAISDARINLKK